MQKLPFSQLLRNEVGLGLKEVQAAMFSVLDELVGAMRQLQAG